MENKNYREVICADCNRIVEVRTQHYKRTKRCVFCQLLLNKQKATERQKIKRAKIKAAAANRATSV